MQIKTLQLSSQVILTLLVSIIVSSIADFQYYRSLMVYAEGEDGRNDNSNNPLITISDNIFGNLAKQFGSFTKQFEYTIGLDGKQIFPNDTIKQDIVANYKSHTYNISSLKYRIVGFDISASDIKMHVNPSKVDATKTKIDFPLLFARNVTVSNGVINLRYHEINLGSIYGIYDKTTDKMTMHIPVGVALQYLPHNIAHIYGPLVRSQLGNNLTALFQRQQNIQPEVPNNIDFNHRDQLKIYQQR